jgi:hypothetical protein
MSDALHLLFGLAVGILLLRLLIAAVNTIRGLLDPAGYEDWKWRREQVENAGTMAALPWVIGAIICMFFAPGIAILLFLIAGVANVWGRVNAGK